MTKSKKKSGKRSSDLTSTMESLHDADNDSHNNDDNNENITTKSATLSKENLQRQEETQTNCSEKEEKEDIDEERSYGSKKGYFGGKPIFPVLKPINI